MFGRKIEVADDLTVAQNTATQALSLFHQAKSGLEVANSTLADVIDTANAEIQARHERVTAAQTARRNNEQVIASLTSIVGE